MNRHEQKFGSDFGNDQDQDSDYKVRGSKRRQSNIRKLAEDLARQRGGEVEDWLSEADSATPRDPPKYNDDGLTFDGYKLAAIYPYTDPQGVEVYQSLRYQHTTIPGAKTFRQRRTLGPKLKSEVALMPWYTAGAGPVKVPFRWPELVQRPNETIFWCEGEKDALRLLEAGLLATTAAGGKLSAIIAKAMTGRDIVIFPDFDDVGRAQAEEVARAFEPFAKSIRIVPLPGLRPTEDVSDWLDVHKNTVDELLAIVAKTRANDSWPTPAVWIAPKLLPMRQWLYGDCYIRQYLSVLVSHGGTGKSTLALTEAIAMASGKPILGVQLEKPLRVWYFNGEDPMEEIQRRFQAICLHHNISEADIAGRLFLDSGRQSRLIIGEIDPRTRNGVVSETMVQRVIERLQRLQIDVGIIDPFIKSHNIPENDNSGIDRVAEAWARIADVTNASILLSHHTRKGKSGNDAHTVDDSRGASALIDASRHARVLNRMRPDEAEKAQIDEHERWRYIRCDDGKTSMTPPPEFSTWFKLASQDLDNGPENSFEIDGDNVGVMTSWSFPRANEPPITSYQLSAVLSAIKAGRWRADPQSTQEPWVGIAVADVLKIDIASPKTRKANRKRVSKLVKEWLQNGWLRVKEEKDAGRNPRKYVEVGPAKPPGTPSATPDEGVAAWEAENGF